MRCRPSGACGSLVWLIVAVRCTSPRRAGDISSHRAGHFPGVRSVDGRAAISLRCGTSHGRAADRCGVHGIPWRATRRLGVRNFHGRAAHRLGSSVVSDIILRRGTSPGRAGILCLPAADCSTVRKIVSVCWWECVAAYGILLRHVVFFCGMRDMRDFAAGCGIVVWDAAHRYGIRFSTLRCGGGGRHRLLLRLIILGVRIIM